MLKASEARVHTGWALKRKENPPILYPVDGTMDVCLRRIELGIYDSSISKGKLSCRFDTTAPPFSDLTEREFGFICSTLRAAGYKVSLDSPPKEEPPFLVCW